MGHPGGEVIDLIDGFRAAGLAFVLTRQEAAAGFMADAMASESGIPAVCMGTLGPGATNLVTGVAQAYLDRSPVIAITGQLPMDRVEIATHQKLDLRALFAPVTKWQARVSPTSAGDIVDQALRVALRPRRGPVYLEVPSDVPGQDAPAADRQIHYGARGMSPELTLPIDPGSAGAAANLLRHSARPLILVGMDANDEIVASRLRAFAEEWSIPVMDSPKSKGVFREDHPLFIGTIEMLGTQRLYELIDTCDLVFMIGVDPVEFDRDWTAKANVVHVNTVPNEERYYHENVEIVGPIHEAIDTIRSLCGSGRAKWPANEVKKIRDSFRAFVSPTRHALTPQRALAALRAALPEDAIATCDVGYNKAVTGQCWQAYGAKRFFMSNGLSSMGYGLPAAIGLKLLHRDVPVACVVGDGGFAMTMAELETAARLDVSVLCVVLDDGALSQIKAGQDRKGLPSTGTTFGGLDYVSIAKGFGAIGYAVATEAECTDAFAAARDAKQSVVVAARIDPSAYRLS
jgi:acetolactate synthase-1/2/3 large subunit